MREDILLVGGGGHCVAVVDVLEQARLSIAGIVHGPECSLEAVLGYAALGRDADLAVLRQTYAWALVTVGQVKSPDLRIKIFNLLKRNGFFLPVAISPLSHVSPHAQLGEGTIVMHGALVNAASRIGKNCIINSQALIEHECRIGNHCHIAVGATLCGNVQVGEGSFVGAGCVVKQGLRIGARCLIGMGSVVLHDIADGTQYVQK